MKFKAIMILFMEWINIYLNYDLNFIPKLKIKWMKMYKMTL